MEEDDDNRACLEFLQEMNVNRGCGMRTATFVEEDSDAFDWRDRGSAKGRGEAECVCGSCGTFVADTFRIELCRKDMRRRNTVGSFGSPLIFFAKAPKDEDAGENNGECESEPSAVGNLGESRGKIETVKRADNKEATKDNDGWGSPDDQGHKGNHRSCNEGYKNNTYTVSLTETSGLEVRPKRLSNKVYSTSNRDLRFCRPL